MNSSTDIISVIPSHIGIIPDGNRRWARERGLPTLLGHREGAEQANRLILHANERGIKALSMWGFSTENWKRSEEEVGYLMNLIFEFVAGQWEKLARKNIKFQFSGDLTTLPDKLQKLLADVHEKAKNNTGLVFNMCLSYGGRDELLRAMKTLLERSIKPAEVTEKLVGSVLDTHGLPDIDLIIRSSGEQRLSGFFPWQSVYAELYFSPLLFPDFTTQKFDEALDWYAQRQRRFGK